MKQSELYQRTKRTRNFVPPHDLISSEDGVAMTRMEQFHVGRMTTVEEKYMMNNTRIENGKKNDSRS